MKKNWINKIGKIASILMVTAVVFTGCGASKEEKKTEQEVTAAKAEELATVRASAVSQGQDLWFGIIEEHTGIYEKNGIDLQTTEFAMGVNAVDAIATDQLDIGLLADYAIVNRIGNTAENTDLSIFTEISEGDTQTLYVEKGIKQASDLEGKHVATIAGTVYDYWYAKFFEKFSVDSAKVIIDQVTSPAEAVALAQEGNTSAFWTSEGGDTAAKLEALGWVPYTTKDNFDVGIYTVLVGNRTWLDSNKETVVKYLKATNEVINYIKENTDTVAEWIAEKTGQSKEIAKATIEASIESLKLGFTTEAYEALSEINAYALDNGNYDSAFDVADFLDLEAVSEAFPENVSYHNPS